MLAKGLCFIRSHTIESFPYLSIIEPWQVQVRMIYFLVDSMKTVLKEQKKEVRQFFFIPVVFPTLLDVTMSYTEEQS